MLLKKDISKVKDALVFHLYGMKEDNNLIFELTNIKNLHLQSYHIPVYK